MPEPLDGSIVPEKSEAVSRLADFIDNYDPDAEVEETEETAEDITDQEGGERPDPENDDDQDPDTEEVKPEATNRLEEIHEFPGPGGEQLRWTLQELYSSANRVADYKASMDALKAKEAELDRIIEERSRDAVAKQLEAYSEIGRYIDPQLAEWRQMSDFDKAKLARTNPGEYLAREQDARARENYYAQMEERLVELKKKTADDFLSRQAELLKQKRPEWSEAAKWSEFRGRAVGLLGEYGFSEQEFDSFVDHRVFLVLDDLVKLKTGSKALAAKETKVAKPAPRIIKTGASTARAKTTDNTDKTTKLLQRAKKSGDRNDRLAAIASMFDNS